eukprot:9141318-Pyramimonas_sp.AAC.1
MCLSGATSAEEEQVGGLAVLGRHPVFLAPGLVTGLCEQCHEQRLSPSGALCWRQLRYEMPNESARCLVGAVFCKRCSRRPCLAIDSASPRLLFHVAFLRVDVEGFFLSELQLALRFK